MMSIKEGEETMKCPKCGSELQYGCGTIEDNQYGYDVECPDCNWCGVEWYELAFLEHIGAFEPENN